MAVTTSHEDAVETNTTDLRSAAAAEALLLDVVRRNADELLRVARMHSLCLDDAHDAYQRSLEQFLRHGRRLRGETADGWLFTVVKHEAQAVRRSRSELVGDDEIDFDRLEARHDASPEDHALAADAVTRSAEALRALKPQELRALWLRAGGRSYAEIQRTTGWSYTKVNRCLTEGRRAFLRRCAELEAGAECERWSGLLATVAAGEARAEDLAALRPHLRRCAACKATLRALYASSESMAVVLPPGLVGLAVVEGHGGAERLEAAGRWLTRLYEAAVGPVQERAATGALKWHAAVETTAAGKVAAVAASTVALAAGGAVARDAERRGGPERPAAARAADPAASPVPPVSLPVRGDPGGGTATTSSGGRAGSTPARGPARVSGVRVRERFAGSPAGPAVDAGRGSGRAGSPASREFALDPSGLSGSPRERDAPAARRRPVAASAARVARAPRLETTGQAPIPVRVSATLPVRPAGTDFDRTPPRRSVAAPASAARRPARASPAASEFGP